MSRIRRSAVGVIAIALAVGCAPINYAPRFPERPEFHETALQRVRVGMNAAQIVALFGQPDRTYELTLGADTDREWKGRVYEYFVRRDTLYEHQPRYYTNRFTFSLESEPPRLNHWIIEHLFESTESTGR